MTTNSENLSYPHDHQPAPWGVTDPISYGFKRIFSRTWHMWIGLSLIFIVALIALIVAMITTLSVPLDVDNPSALTGGQIAALVVFYGIVFVVSIYLTALYYKAALRETHGQEQTWGNVFKVVPIGRALLAFIVVLGFMLVVYAIFALVIFLASLVSSWLIALVGILALIAFIPVTIILSFVQVNIIDGYGVGDALSAARRDVMREFWKILASLLLLTLIGYAITIVTLGLGLAAYIPLASLVTVYIYRKISGGNVVPLSS